MGRATREPQQDLHRSHGGDRRPGLAGALGSGPPSRRAVLRPPRRRAGRVRERQRFHARLRRRLDRHGRGDDAADQPAPDLDVPRHRRPRSGIARCSSRCSSPATSASGRCSASSSISVVGLCDLLAERSAWLEANAWALGAGVLLLAGVYQFTPAQVPLPGQVPLTSELHHGALAGQPRDDRRHSCWGRITGCSAWVAAGR